MTLLFDNNLSPRLVEILTDCFPLAIHVRSFGYEKASDQQIWEYAKANSRVIVSKDADFHQRSFLYGAPPKVIWIRRGNCSTTDMARLLRTRVYEIESFLAERDAAFLVIS